MPDRERTYERTRDNRSLTRDHSRERTVRSSVLWTPSSLSHSSCSVSIEKKNDCMKCAISMPCKIEHSLISSRPYDSCYHPFLCPARMVHAQKQEQPCLVCPGNLHLAKKAPRAQQQMDASGSSTSLMKYHQERFPKTCTHAYASCTAR
jgi:hypothetical protein